MTKNEASIDAENAYSIINYQNINGFKTIRDNNSCLYDRVYRTTNESSVSYMEDVVKEGSNILSVAASGDQYLNSILYGANEVSLFDINILSYYQTMLRIVSARVLTREEYKIFLLDTLDSYNQNGYYGFMNETLYNKVSRYLPINVKEYYDKLYILSKQSHFILPMETLYHSNERIDLLSRCPYIEKGYYELLQRKLESKSLPPFQLGDISEILPRTKKKYDGIILSNIMDYSKGDFISTISKYGVPLLNEDGIILLCYLWGSLDLNKEYKDIDLEGNQIELKEFLPIYNSKSKMKDAVMYLRKRK